MDTAYYAAGAAQMARGGGFSEPFIWNYLSNPDGIPHPGFLYWMPLPSLLAAPFAVLLPGSFFALQIPFAILSATIPLVAYSLTWRASGRRGLARATGLLAIFSGFFFPYWTLPETFAPFALLGSLAMWLAGTPVPGHTRIGIKTIRSLSAGLLVGLAHLTRADGVLLLPVVALGPLAWRPMMELGKGGNAPETSTTVRSRRNALTIAAVHLLTVAVGYTLVMGPWFGRNLLATGTPLSPAGTKTIWLTEYDDLFCYDCDLSPSSYLAWGWGHIVRSKLSALWINVQRFLAEDCLIFLLPFAAIGFHRLRRHPPFILALVYLGAIYLIHSLVFTFPGWRGGFFHASSAVLPFLYAASLCGLDAATRWATKRRSGWRYQQARSVFSAAAVAGAMIFSSYIAWRKIPAWRGADTLYKEVDRWLTNQDAPGARVMVNNPPAFWYHTERESVVVPNEDVHGLVQVAERYDVDYVLIEKDHPAPLSRLWAGTGSNPDLDLVASWGEGEGAMLYHLRRTRD
jgi:hypothetical protein